MKAVAQARDGIGSATILDDLVQKRIGEDTDLLRWAYQSGETNKNVDTTWKRFADLAPLVFEAYEQSDEGKR